MLLNLEQEVPHAVAVEVEEFAERSPTLTYIRVVIYVERDSQKGILIGRGGAMLKKDRQRGARRSGAPARHSGLP